MLRRHGLGQADSGRVGDSMQKLVALKVMLKLLQSYLEILGESVVRSPTKHRNMNTCQATRVPKGI